MAITTTALRRNLSRFELALAVLVLTVLVTLFLRRMESVSAAAEEAMVRTRVQDMQARLMTLRAGFVSGELGGRPVQVDDVVRLLARGDVPWVATARGFDWATVPEGSWVYFEDRREFAYRVIHRERFAAAGGDPLQLRFQLEVLRAATTPGGSGAGRIVGARLVPLASAAWTAEP
ncbi:MAG: hypothetical protein H6977_04760 [Gammaproteobacteria bacterium]|nr:hypothetical protein [Gammaproteobacteria bacterium]MCP5199298.1 hypothetical protein [Gammaproteobacteria bacterium]